MFTQCALLSIGLDTNALIQYVYKKILILKVGFGKIHNHS